MQRMYQAAFNQNTRLWKIVSDNPPGGRQLTIPADSGRGIPTEDGLAEHPRSRWLLTPYLFLLWGTAGG